MTSIKEIYNLKLKDPRWQKKRLEIFERDEWRCMLCDSRDKTLTVHHRYYLRGYEPWDYPNEALATLCEECHDEERTNTAEALANLVDAAGSTLWAGDIQALAGDLVSIGPCIPDEPFMVLIGRILRRKNLRGKIRESPTSIMGLMSRQYLKQDHKKGITEGNG